VQPGTHLGHAAPKGDVWGQEDLRDPDRGPVLSFVEGVQQLVLDLEFPDLGAQVRDSERTVAALADLADPKRRVRDLDHGVLR
jgi:hypothetical protein